VDSEIREIEILEKRIQAAVHLIDGLKKREDDLKDKLRGLEDENKRLKVETEGLAKAKDVARGKVQALLDKLKLIEE
jgi:FtsZ-binding cell division protein ZapB